MSPLYLALLAAVAAAAAGWLLRRRAAARRAACRQWFAAWLAAARPELSLVPAIAPEHWRLQRDGQELATVDGKRLTRALSGDEEQRQRLCLAVADAAALGPRPFAGKYDLKTHGRRTLPRLADEGLPLLMLGPTAARHTAADSAGLATIYVVDSKPRPVYLAAEHLDGAGIDTRDVHGVALAVLRQRFDEPQARAALDSAEVSRIEATDGCSGSRILLLPEVLRPGETVFAAAPAPDRLLVAADRGTLEAALTEMPEPALPLPPAIFRITSGGLRMES